MREEQLDEPESYRGEGAEQRGGIMDDPTRTAALKDRLAEVLADPCVQRQSAGLATRKVALVLSAGGGKGAYELGALLAACNDSVPLPEPP